MAQFTNLNKFSSKSLKVSNRDYKQEMFNLLSTRKGELAINPSYGISNLMRFFYFSNDLSLLVPLLTVTLKEDIENNSDFIVDSVQLFRNQEDKKIIEVYIKYSVSNTSISNIVQLRLV